MIVSHKKSFVMLLPWKTASQTVRRRLARYDAGLYSEFFYFNSYLNRVVHQHITCADFACLPESKIGYFIGAFIRNPYDRVYSGFRQLQTDIKLQPRAKYPAPWIRDLVASQLAENQLQLQRAQYEIDAWLKLVGDEQIYEIGRNSNFPLHPVHYWTHIAGKQVVDFVGRVEAFEEDFEAFLSKVGIASVEQVNANVVEMQGDSKVNPFGYRYVNRMNSRSIGRINALFKDDFEIFGYDKVD
jgi:hypothetical protein